MNIAQKRLFKPFFKSINKMRLLAIVVLLCFANAILGQNIDSFQFKSDALRDSRWIKVWTPKDYSKDKKYTVVYTLDASWMFDITCSDVDYLSRKEVGVIPNTIVVGVFFADRNEDMGILWETSQLNERGQAFKKMLSEELAPHISKIYPTTGFNTIVGHGHSSTFINFLLLDAQSPFKGYIAMSQQELATDEANISNLLGSNLSKTIYYFLASASKDTEYRVQSGNKFEKIFNSTLNAQFKFEHFVFKKANHLTVALMGLPQGLTHVYQDFKSLDAKDTALIGELAKTKTNPLAYLNKHKEDLEKLYGIKPVSTVEDLYFMTALAEKNKDYQQIQELWALAQKDYKEEEGLYFLFAQLYESAGVLRTAEDFYLKHLETDDYKAYHAYSRLFYLYYTHQKDPHKAFKMAQRANKEYAEKSKDYSFYYHIAQTSAKFNTKTHAGKKAIEEYIENYKEGARFSLEEANYQKAMIYSNSNRSYEAKQILEEILKTKPDYTAAKELLEALKEE
jgi:predicted alpha/beta superfamily hydrolase